MDEAALAKLPPPERDRAKEIIAARAPGSALFAGFIGIATIVVGTPFMLFASFVIGGPILALLLGGLPIVAGLFLGRATHRARIEHLVATKLRKGQCLWCDYDLTGATTSAFSLTCPECGKDSPRLPTSPTPG
ncbi:MAG: hypothetical protein KDA20_07805 [Phycisphaerales bacterium]|nr:hypothetical protein [Phycisphaerales bacterium]